MNVQSDQKSGLKKSGKRIQEDPRDQRIMSPIKTSRVVLCSNTKIERRRYGIESAAATPSRDGGDFLLLSPSPLSAKNKITSSTMKFQHPGFISPPIITPTPASPTSSTNNLMFDGSSISAITLDTQLLMLRPLDESLSSIPASSNHTDNISSVGRNDQDYDSCQGHNGLFINHDDLGSTTTTPSSSQIDKNTDVSLNDAVSIYVQPLKESVTSSCDNNSLAKIYRRATYRRQRSWGSSSKRREVQVGNDCQVSSSFDRFASTETTDSTLGKDTIPFLTSRSSSSRTLSASESDDTVTSGQLRQSTKSMTNKNNVRSSKKMCVLENLDSTKHSIQSMRSIREDKILSEEGNSISYADDEESGGKHDDYEDCDDFEEDDARDYEDFVEELVDASSDRIEFIALKSQDDFHVGHSTSNATALSTVADSVVETAVRVAAVSS